MVLCFFVFVFYSLMHTINILKNNSYEVHHGFVKVPSRYISASNIGVMPSG